MPDALDTVGALRDSGRFASVDYLGEDTTSNEDAERTVQAYLTLLDGLAQRGDADAAVRPLEVSLKLSALGQALPRDGEKIAYENAHTICAKAREVGAWVTVDAEDHTTTDSTLSIVRDLRTEFDWLGTVLQAYLHRTESRLPRVRRSRRPDPALQGRLRRTCLGGLPRRRGGHRLLPAVPARARWPDRATRWWPHTIR